MVLYDNESFFIKEIKDKIILVGSQVLRLPLSKSDRILNKSLKIRIAKEKVLNNG